jgi:hypothetical protein
MSFDIAKLSRNFDEVSDALSITRKLTSADREILRLRIDDLRRFFSACLIDKAIIEKTLNWHDHGVRR